MKIHSPRAAYLDIGVSLMRTYVFSINGDYEVKDFDLIEDLTPGSLTVFICEVIEFLDIDHLVKVITVAIPGVVDDETKLIKSFADVSGWLNVPLRDWIEIRLRKKVHVIPKDSFDLIDQPICIWR